MELSAPFYEDAGSGREMLNSLGESIVDKCLWVLEQ
jgi:hypothetical protein